MSRLELQFKSDIAKLIGNPFGKQVYEEQVKGKIDLNDNVRLVLPERINRVASSFVQGFFDDIVRQVGISGVKDKFEFETSIPNFKEFVLENLE